MHRLILVDDEQQVLNGIRTVFDLEGCGFSLVGTYTNPLAALEELGETLPDLVITDIKMPGMTGIDLAERVKKALPDTEVVILSGYGDFEFARASIGLGVAEYILKPVKQADFSRMLAKMEKRIRERKARAGERAELERTARENLAGMRDRFFQELISGTVDERECGSRAGSLGLKLPGKDFIIVKVMPGDAAGKTDHESSKARIVSFLMLQLRKFGVIEAFRGGECVFFVLQGFGRRSGEIRECLEESLTRFKALHGIPCTAAISRIHSGFREFFPADMECDAALVYAFINNLQVASSGEDRIDAMGSPISGNEFEGLMIAISLRDREKMEGILERMFKPFLGVSAGVDYFYGIALVILIKLRDLQDTLAGGTRPVSDEEITMKFLRTHCATAKALKEFLLERINPFMLHGAPDQATSAGKTVSSVIRYINAHLAEDISTEDLAGHVNVSRNYLCHIFKKATGTTLLDYIVDVRVRRAKELLKDRRFKMYEIAGMVGYRDYAYFSQVFKKQTGMTLSQHRNTL